MFLCVMKIMVANGTHLGKEQKCQAPWEKIQF